MRVTKVVRRFMVSFTIIFKSLKYIVRNPRIWPLLIVPFILNIAICLTVFTLFYSKFGLFIDSSLDSEFFQKVTFITLFAKVIGAIITLLISLWIFVLLGMIVSAPFNGILIERVLKQQNILKVERYRGIKLIIFEIGRALKFEFVKIILSIFVFFLTILLNLVPVVGNFLFVGINFLFNVFINVLDLSDPAFARIDYSFRKQAKTIFRNIDLFLIFGIITTLIFTIPIVNFLYIPIASISATFLFIEFAKAKKESYLNP
jgi:CysZ protein